MSTLFYAVYELRTGKVVRTGSCPQVAEVDMLAAQVRPGEGVIETPEGQLDANAIVFDLASKRIAHLKF